MIGFELNERQRALQQMTHDFAAKEIRPAVTVYDRHADPRECIPWEVIKKGNQLGFASLIIPEEYGGFGASDLEYAIWMEEIAWGDAGMYLTYCGHNLVVNNLKRGTEEQKRKWFGKIVDDKTNTYLACLVATEHGSAGDATPRTYREKPGQPVTVQDFFTQSTVPIVERREMTKMARRDGDNYILNGMGRFNTNSGLASLYGVSAKLDPSLPDRGNSASFMVEWGTPGLSIGHVENKIGCRCCQQAETILDNVVVPAENMIRPRARLSGSSLMTTAAAGENASGIGVARAAFEAALEYAQVRYKNGNRIIFHQAVQLMLVDMFVKIQSARLFLWKACAHNDTTNHGVPSPLPELTKAITTDVAMDVATKAVQIFGGYGLMREFPVEKWFRDSKVLQIQHGANDTVYAELAMPWIIGGIGY